MKINAEITAEARDYLNSLLAEQDVPGMAARIYVENAGKPHAETLMAYCPPGQEAATDVMQDFQGLTVYFDAESIPYLQDIRIFMEGNGDAQTVMIKAPHTKKPAKPPKTFVLPNDCEAQRVPHGDSVTLPEGASVAITQALGGSFTVKFEGNLYRLSPEVTRTLGLYSDTIFFEPPADGRISDQQCWEALRQVYDPEIPVNIVSLGLVYKLEIDQDTGRVRVEMTLTSPGCGMGNIIAGEVHEKLLQVPLVKNCDVDIVFDPPWSYDNLEEEARLELGLI